jgi:hypothetical protein
MLNSHDITGHEFTTLQQAIPAQHLGKYTQHNEVSTYHNPVVTLHSVVLA